MPRQDDPADPRGLIYESYRIEGIGKSECRSIFLDWAIGVPIGQDSSEFVRKLLGRFGAGIPRTPYDRRVESSLGPNGARWTARWRSRATTPRLKFSGFQCECRDPRPIVLDNGVFRRNPRSTDTNRIGKREIFRRIL